MTITETILNEKLKEVAQEHNKLIMCYPFQQTLIDSKAQRQIWNKSRQIGFSFGVALREFGFGVKYNNWEALYFSVGQRLAAEWLDKIRTLCLMYKIDPIVNKQTEIKLPNGSRFIALPQNPATARSYSPDEIILDEYAHYKQDKKMLTALAPALSRKDKYRTLIIGSTPFGKIGEFFKIFDGQNNYTKYQIDINEAIRQGVPLNYEDCRLALPDDVAFQQEHLCQFIDDVTSFFPYELIKQAWNENLQNMSFESMATLKETLIAGYDPGKLVDSGVFQVIGRTKDKVIHRHQKVWDKVDYSKQLEYICEAMRVSKITKLYIDATGVGVKLIEDLKKVLGSRVQGITFTNPVKEKMIIDMKVLFETNNMEIMYDMKLTNQLHSLQRSVLQSKMIRYSHPTGEHDDMVWALALATISDYNTKRISVREIGATNGQD